MPGPFLPTKPSICAALIMLEMIALHTSAQLTGSTQISTTGSPQAATATATASSSATTTSSTASPTTATTTSSSSSSMIVVLLIVIPVILIFAGVVRRILKHRAAAQALKNAKTTQITNNYSTNYYMQTPPAVRAPQVESKVMHSVDTRLQARDNDTLQHGEHPSAKTEGEYPIQNSSQSQMWPPTQPAGQEWSLPYYHAHSGAGATLCEQPPQKKKGWTLFG